MSVKRIILLFVLLGGFCSRGFVRAEVFEVTPVMETRPVSHSGDSADDARIWVHPTDPNKSVIIGTDKDDDGGLAVYDLAGNRLSFTAAGRMNNVDVRYNFPLATGKVDIIAVGNRTNDSIAVYTIDPNSLELSNIAARTISIGIEEAYGFCLYHSWRTNKHYAFVNDKNGQVEQWALFGDQNGKVDAVRVRAFDVGSQTEGITADDQLGYLYVGEEDVGIWKYRAEPTGPADDANRVLVDSANGGGHLAADVEGLTIYYARGVEGYLIASSQGEGSSGHPLADTFAVYRREGNNEHLMNFRIIANGAAGIDKVSNTDGIAVTSAPLGSRFPKGIFVAQDGSNTGANQNFKAVPWESIATAVTPGLAIDVEWNPRNMPGDLTGDGNIGIDDIGEFVNQWLETAQSGDTNGDRAVNCYDLQALCSEWLGTMLGLQADFNTDRSVDFRDFAVIGSKWGRNHLYPPADFNTDGRVDFCDFARLADMRFWRAGSL